MVVIKRNGQKVDFDQNKIYNAIEKANKEVDPQEQLQGLDLDIITNEVAISCNELCSDSITIEQIQDFVEEELIAAGYGEVARKYIKYRYLHDLAREHYNSLMETVTNKIAGKNVENKNANLDEFSFGGRVGETSDAILKQYALDFIVSPKTRENHLNNEIYIHDLSSYAVGNHNCLSIPFDDLLKNGFNTRQTDIRPANSVNTAFQLVRVIFQLQSLQQFGGVSRTHLDWTMVPYIRKSFYKHYIDGLKYIENIELEKRAECPEDKSIDDDDYKFYPKVYRYAMQQTEKEVYQAVEGMYHNLNTLQSRSGNQLPFSSINYGTCTLPEGRMVIKAILDVSIEGLGQLKRTSIFPCGIFQVMEGVNKRKGDPNYDLFRLALKSTSQRLYPNYRNVDWSGNRGYDRNDPRTFFSTMGERKLWPI